MFEIPHRSTFTSEIYENKTDRATDVVNENLNASELINPCYVSCLSKSETVAMITTRLEVLLLCTDPDLIPRKYD